MKSKAIFLICLYMVIGLTRLSAQIPDIGKSGSWAFTFTFEGFGEYAPINCDVNRLDLLVGSVRCHTVYHWTHYDGNPLDWDWCRQQFDGEIVSQLTQEVFKVKDIGTVKGPYTNPATGHFNLIGNQGSHYIVNYIWDMNGFTIVNVKCPGASPGSDFGE